MNIKVLIKDVFDSAKKYAVYFIFWTALGLLMGFFGGTVGSVFVKLLELVTEVREEHKFLIMFLPLAGLVIVGIYELCGLKKAGTNEVFENVRGERSIQVLLAPAVFVGTALTHLFGGSAGREGAALQIGGSLASLIGKIMPISEKQRHILTMCGMSALFSALFGTPVGACVFAVEVASTGKLYTAAFYPCIVSSLSAYIASLNLGVRPERFYIGTVSWMQLDSVWKTAIIGVASALVGILFCSCMHLSHKLFEKYFPNKYIRIAAGGALIVLLTIILHTDDYNGSGHAILNGIFEHHPIAPEAFLLKMLFTAITMGAGFKGGEIVPTLFIGATLGGTLASVLGLSVPFGAAIGMLSLFSAVTNCPITALILFVELFGANGIILCMLAIMISYVLSGRFSLYEGQKMKYSRLDDGTVK